MWGIGAGEPGVRACVSLECTWSVSAPPQRGDRRRHLFEGRYKAIVCDRDGYLLELVRLHSSQSGQSCNGQAAQRMAVERARGILGKGKARTDRLRTSHGRVEDGRRYEAFIREGAKVNYRAEWHPGDGAPFLGPERFVKKMAKETIPPPVSRRSSLKDLLKSVATKASLTPMLPAMLPMLTSMLGHQSRGRIGHSKPS